MAIKIRGFEIKEFQDWYKNNYKTNLTSIQVVALTEQPSFDVIADKFQSDMHDLMCGMAGVA